MLVVEWSNRWFRSVALIAVILFSAAACRQSAAAEESIDFEREVAPILQRRCLACHNDRDRRGGLSLQSAKAARAGGESGEVIAPGEPASSYLLDLVIPHDETAEMPKGEPPLTQQQVESIRRWITAGAVWPEGVVLEPPVLWSLTPLRRPPAAAIAEQRAGFPIRNAIDAFAAAGHRKAHVEAAPQADRRTLIRRLYLDLVGLPPAPAAVEAFVADDDPLAYELLVDQLLASPHFGEHWGRHWLDLARYADSDGYLGDAIRQHAWVYREWVIDAINQDLPFDEFSIEQLAGDLLEAPTLSQRIATGFHRNTLRNTEAGVDLELYRTKEIVDRVNTTGMVWLGLTLGCAECHDHKNDPVTQREFYRLYAFFNNADEVTAAATRPWEKKEYERAQQSWRPAWEQLVAELADFEIDELTDEQKTEIEKTLDEQTKATDLKAIAEYYRTDDPDWSAMRAKVEQQLKAKPVAPSTKAPVFAPRTKDRRETHIHIRGVYNRPGEQVHPGTPAVLPELQPRGSTPDRLDLARWIFHADNPLTPRVAVNRIWQHLFGVGLVATPNDFGTKGAEPTHPQLLDWLATEYRRRGWSRKAMIRLIVMSSTYRMASAVNAVPGQQDLGNLALWRQNSLRVDAETVRDVHLAASGLLDTTIGRRGIRPPLPAFVTEVGRSVQWPVSEGGERYRRGMYILFKRTVPYPMLMTFDAPDAAISCSRRERSNTPLQALTLLNDPVFYECAQTLGRQIAERHPDPDDLPAATDEIFRRCLARPPAAAEREALIAAYRDLHRLARQGDEAIEPAHDPHRAAITAAVRIVMNLDEFITRD
ncbi:MAG: PSD1 and planctomycete cytochrome C domain-containing protein [Pirellulaceae bacterium]